MFIFDGHLDLSMNALEWNRDLRKPVSHIRDREKGKTDKPDRGNNTVSFPEMRHGRIGMAVATLIARYVDENNPLPGWNSPEQAWAQTQGQLAWYKEMEAQGEMVHITDYPSLEKHVASWKETQDPANLPIGYILSLEGADSLVSLEHLAIAHTNGLRAIGPAHYGPGRYANGTDSSGKMGKAGLELLHAMEQKNIILDATHLCDDAFWQAMDHFHGPVWASHNNCRSIVPHNRQYSDEQLKVLIERKAVIGAAMDAWMIVPGWIRRQSTPEQMDCHLEKLIDHMDHICQLAGNASHIAIGSDLDGAFGREQSPYDIDTIADLQKIPALLSKRGYATEDIENIMHGNWMRFLREAWK